MELITGVCGRPTKLGILPGTFNPPTRAHVALARAALSRVDRVLLVLPGALPHKTWEGASREQRIEMLRTVAESDANLAAGVSEGGLFIDMVREARVWFPQTEFFLVCGRDAAERIVGWDYGSPDAIVQMLAEFRLLVAPRHGQYEPPAHVAHAVEALDPGCWDDHSSTLAREGLLDLVPESIRPMAERIYS